MGAPQELAGRAKAEWVGAKVCSSRGDGGGEHMWRAARSRRYIAQATLK
jgi:hypothetical protein